MAQQVKIKYLVIALLSAIANMAFSDPLVSKDSPVDVKVIAATKENLEGGEFFTKNVAPLLEKRCLGCHNSEKSKGKVSLSTFKEVFQGKKKIIVKGKPEESLLYKVIIPQDGEEPEMPEDDDIFSKEETAIIKKWIADGAKWPENAELKERAKADKSWWAYSKLKHSSPKAVDVKGWDKNPIDAYILEKLNSAGLKPSETASKRNLIRRAYYDLTGLPPSIGEVEAFTEDKSPDAWEKVIDRLLASPHYGERWGRHWLDVVRFGESNGYERNVIINDLWPFRDYVIKSINDDKPFNQFIKEHIAGDVIARGNPAVEIGSAFLVAGPYDDVGNQDAIARAVIRADQMDEMIRTTSEAFLGMTMGCAKCHDHKFDPIATADYYSMYSVFSGVRHGRSIWASKQAKDAHKNRISPLNNKLRLAVHKLREYEKSISPISKRHKEVRLKKQVTTDKDLKIIQQLRREVQKVRREIAKVKPLPKAWIGKRSARDAKGPFHIFKGGDVRKKGAEVTASSLSTLSEVTPSFKLPPNAAEGQRRLSLAEWIVHNDNPLSPRVLANRIWHYHFGTGIVNTPSDFGYMGGRPSHPELLDFLALELKKNNWKIKALHKLIMTSKTYMQNSAMRQEAAQKDGDSRLLWRFPPRRLNAEEIRDTILQVSGKLDTKMGGPGFRLYKFTQDNVCTYFPLDQHGPETYRRAVYHQNVRASTVDLLTDFDQADCSLSVGKRTVTTTPLQALTMLNHSFSIDMAEALKTKSSAENPAAQVKKVFRFAYQRNPTAAELKYASALIRENGLRALCRAVLNSNELIYLD